jgi:hypothetical protein
MTDLSLKPLATSAHWPTNTIPDMWRSDQGAGAMMEIMFRAMVQCSFLPRQQRGCGAFPTNSNTVLLYDALSSLLVLEQEICGFGEAAFLQFHPDTITFSSNDH